MVSSETPPEGAALVPEPPDPHGWDDDESTVMMEALSSGSFFGDRFQLGAPLGSGAMGRVVQAIDLQAGGEVALKVLHRERARDAEALERFRREAAILAAIGHPAIVRVVAMGAAPDGTPWLAMELLRGETLKQRLRRGPLDAREIVPVLNTLCDALEAAHTRGIVHRDLKPENVLLPQAGTPSCKLLDFGLSRFTASKTLTRTGTILGTPRYMAPEQIRSASSADLRVDVFSVGVLLYEMLTARSPYPADDLGQLLGCVLEGRTVPIAQVRPDLPPAVGAVIARAMASLPANRFQTAGAIAEAYAASIGLSSGRSMLRSAPELAGSFPERAEGSSPLVDPFGAVVGHDRSSAPGGASAPGLADNPLLATMAPGSFGAPSSAPPPFIGAAGGPPSAARDPRPMPAPAPGGASWPAPGPAPGGASWPAPGPAPGGASWPGGAGAPAGFTRPRSATPMPGMGAGPAVAASRAKVAGAAAPGRTSAMWIAFVLALVIVVIGAAAAAIALRALMHGSVHLPGMTTSP